MQLLTFAYDLRSNQVVGAPGWFDLGHFDVSFTPDKPDPGVQPGHFREMSAMFNRNRQRMQAVLRDRLMSRMWPGLCLEKKLKSPGTRCPAANGRER